MVNQDEKFMQRCLDLAAKGLGGVAPNPMVGCVIVYKGKIIGEGLHEYYGGPHAEANAIASVKEKKLLENSTLYVSLEPCTHYGKTPPCTDLIIANKISFVVIACTDSNPLVKGKGIKKLLEAGITVKTAVLEKESRELNRRFFTFHEKKRPYVILKWAQTADGFIDRRRSVGDGQLPLQVSSAEAKKLSHQWRSREQAIMVGTSTALLDNPRLSVREVKDKNPLRIFIDRELKVPAHFHLLDNSASTLVFTGKKKENTDNTEYITLPFDDNKQTAENILNILFKKNIQSVIVEGGKKTLESFIAFNFWDEARVFISEEKIKTGVTAPLIRGKEISSGQVGRDRLRIFRNC